MNVPNGRKSNGKWVDRWREGGRHRQRTFDRRGDRDAFRRERVRRQQLGGLVRLEHDVTLAEFIEDYWCVHAIPNLEPQTRKTYGQQWGKYILPRLGEYELRAINAQVILRELVEPMRRAGDPTLLQVLTVLQAIFAYAVTTDRVTDNPVRRVAKPRQPGGREVPSSCADHGRAAARAAWRSRRADGVRAGLRRTAPPGALALVERRPRAGDPRVPHERRRRAVPLHQDPPEPAGQAAGATRKSPS
jgi:hypothetical protein